MTKRALLVLLWGTLLSQSAHAATLNKSKVSPDLQGTLPSQINVIVQRTPSATSSNSGGLIGGLVGAVVNIVGTLLQDIPLINAILETVTPDDLVTLSNDPTVTYITPDRYLAGSYDHYEYAVNAPAAWSLSLKGSGVTVALLDSGIANVPDLPRPLYRQSFVGLQGDPYGHGTHVAGIIAGNGSSSKNGSNVFAGIAQGVNLVDLQVLNASGGSSDSVVISAIATAISLKDKYNIKVINLSLGRPIQESYLLDPLCIAVEQAWKAGITVVVAAGNGGRMGYSTILSPGNDPYVITVGAMKPMGTDPRNDDLVASYSSRGPTTVDGIIKPDIVAPGNETISVLSPGSTLAGEYPGNIIPPSSYGLTGAPAYLTLNGTSMAAPVVSATAALLIGREPGITPDTIKARLMKTAYKVFPAQSTVVDAGVSYTDYYDALTIGAGYLDIAAALADHDSATRPALSPKANYVQSTGSIYMASNPAALWGSSAMWGNTAVWGSNVIAPDQRHFGDVGILGSLGQLRDVGQLGHVGQLGYVGQFRDVG
jgi:serine protease AprX